MTKEKKASIVLDEIERNRNHSWFREVKTRAQSHLDKPAFTYRGSSSSYRDYIETCENVWAPALKQSGIKKGEEIIVSMSSTPELCYLMGAASLVGARLNFISDEFDKDYVKTICDKSTYKYIFVSEDRLKNHFETIQNMPYKTIIPVKLNHSLPNGNPFEKLTDVFITYNKDEIAKAYEDIDNKRELDDFLEEGKKYKGQVEEESTLDDIFTTSYSSGTTDGNKPKGIVHKNRHYIVMGRYHDSEISGIPNMDNATTFSTIPTQSNSYIASILSDTLMEGATIALDPLITKEYFLYGIKVNRPTMAIATTSTWLYAAKLYYMMPESRKKEFKLSKTIFPVAVGEPMSPGEEKYLNKFVKDLKCGVAITKLPTSISKMSICGGDCEHGSILIRELRGYANILKDRAVTEPIGLRTYDFVDVKVLREDGTYCEPNEYGRLVANSACTMVGYRDEPERTEKFFIKDAYGKTWGDMSCYGFIDKKNNVYMKGRIPKDKTRIPEFLINDEIQKDTKNILSSSVINVDEGEDHLYIAYIEFQPEKRKSELEVRKSIIGRLRKKFGDELIDKLYLRILNYGDEFPLTGCLKRDNGKLREIGLTEKCEKASEIVRDISAPKLTLTK